MAAEQGKKSEASLVDAAYTKHYMSGVRKLYEISVGLWLLVFQFPHFFPSMH